MEYEVLPNNLIKIYSNLDKSGEINSILSTNGIIVERIFLKGQNLEEYFLTKIGGGENA